MNHDYVLESPCNSNCMILPLVLLCLVCRGLGYRQACHFASHSEVCIRGLGTQNDWRRTGRIGTRKEKYDTSLYSSPPSHEVNKKLFLQVQLLVDIWQNVVYPESNEGTNNDDDDGGKVYRLKDYDLTRNDVKGFLQHFQNCKDCAADNSFLMATQDASNDDSLLLTNVQFNLLSESEDEYDSLESGLSEYNLEGDKDTNERPIFPIESNDDIVLADTKIWVRKMIADFGICPFTIDPDKAGIPIGGVRYTVSRAVGADEAFLRYWEEVLHLLSVPEKEIATVLLVFPELNLFGNYELFEAYCESLNDALCSSTLCLESEIQLVFFHPKYQFRDGQARTGDEMGAANFARRSPWPMINILRTPQVRAAQKGVPTGIVYKQNEERLNEVGTNTLEEMLYNRHWDNLPAHSAHAKSLRVRENKGVSGAVKSTIDKSVNECPAHTSTKTAACPMNSEKKSDLMQVFTETKGSSKEEDYLRLAEEVDKWMNNL